MKNDGGIYMQKIDDRLSILEPLSRLIPDVPIFDEYRARSYALYRCSCCHFLVSPREQFCSRCGQAIDWTSLEKPPITFVLSVIAFSNWL